MLRLSLRSVRHDAPLFAGVFLTMALGVALVATALGALWATQRVSPAQTGPSVLIGGQRFFRDAADLQGITTVLALTAVICAFMTVLVVAGSFAFSIALRRRDFGLLRLVGVGPGQVRRLVLGESLVVAVPAGVAGCAVAWAVTPVLVGALNRSGLSPVALPERVGATPLAVGFVAGIALALAGALAASSRAARVRPIEALQDAALDVTVMTPARWAVGLLTLVGGGVMMAAAPSSGAVDAAPLVILGTFALTVAAVTLGPAFLPWLARAASWVGLLPTAVAGRLAMAGVTTARRRTASLVAPTLSVMAVVGIMLGVMETSNATDAADESARHRGELVVEPAAGSAVDAGAVARVAGVAGVLAVSAASPVTLAFSTDGGQQSGTGANGAPGTVNGTPDSGVVQAAAVDLPALVAVEHADVVEGTLAPLTGSRIAVSQDYVGWYGLHVGSPVRLGLFDGRVVDATVAAVVRGGAGLPGIMVSRALAGQQAQPASHAMVLLAGSGQGGAPARVAAALGSGYRVVPATHWQAGGLDGQQRLQQVVVLVMAGPASVFALVAVANTLVMAFSRRRREVAALTLLGVRDRTVRGMVTIEAALVVVLSVAVAALLVGVGLVGYADALGTSFLASALHPPVLELGLLAAAALASAVLVSLIVVGRPLRRAPVAAVGVRE